jgi:hypothetical protein
MDNLCVILYAREQKVCMGGRVTYITYRGKNRMNIRERE